MSESSSDKREETSSLDLDEDSGHDSVDDIGSPAEERERIASLETAVAWIRDEVNQLKDYDKDILQELWKIRNTVQTLREADKKSRKEESRFLDDTIEDRSPTPQSQQGNKTDEEVSPSPSPSPSLSPVSPIMGPDGDRYTESTLQRMATAPTHLRKSSDDKVLEEFFGSEQLTKLNMFKKQISTEDVTALKEAPAAADHLTQIPEVQSDVAGTREEKAPKEVSRNDSKSSLMSSESKGELRLRVAKSHLSDANRISYDVVSEMEKLRARLQETTKQELAEFDRKYSPKLYHSKILEEEGMANNHSRQGSLDSSVPRQTAPVSAVQRVATHAHVRQHSLPVDPSYFKQMQLNHSNDTTPPPLFFGHTREMSGDSLSSDGPFSPPLTPNSLRDQSQLPVPLHNISASSMRPVHLAPNQLLKQSKPPGMSRMSSEGSYSQTRPSSASTNSLNRGSTEGNSLNREGNSLNRGSTEAESQVNGNRSRTTSNPQLHYSTAVIKKRNSQDLSFPQSQPHPQPHPYQGVVGGANTGKPHTQMGVATTGAVGKNVYRYDAKLPNGRPRGYEQPKRRSYGEDVDSAYRVGSGGRYPQLSPPRQLEGNIPASPKMSRRASSDARQQTTTKQYSRASESTARRAPLSQPPQEDIQPYMTSSHVKSEMQKLNYSYTPYSNQQPPQLQPRANTVTAADAPKLSKKYNNPLKSSENTWI